MTAGLLATSSDERSVKQVTTINPGEEPHSSVFFAARSLRNSSGESPATISPKSLTDFLDTRFVQKVETSRFRSVVIRCFYEQRLWHCEQQHGQVLGC